MRPLTLAHLALGTTPEATIEAAAAAGFAAAGVRICARRPGDPFAGEPLLGRMREARELRGRTADLGLRVSNVSAYQFYPDVGWDDVAPAIDVASALGAPIIVANGFDPDLARFTDLLARYCADAHEAGIRIALEFLPYSAVRDLETALRVVMQTGAPNAGVLVDALHLDRSGATPADIARIPPARITFAQLCDARRWSGPRTDALLLTEARTARLPAGEGELPLFAFMDALPPDLEVEYEVARADLAQASPREKARQAFADAQRFMAAYDEHRRAGGKRARR
ncbi:MAG: sugar phosphate isomerase/epimerase [Burkholderiales bacterium]